MTYRDIVASVLDEPQGKALLTSLLVPRPVVWISTISTEQNPRPNVAPFSSVSPICNEPMLISFACGRRPDGARKCSAENILRHREFVINLIGADLLDKIPLSAKQFTGSGNKFSGLNITPDPSNLVKTPSVGESIASFECLLHQHQEFGTDAAKVDFFIGHVLFVRIRREPRFATPELTGSFCPVAALGVDWYLVAGAPVFQPEHT